jgi:hypothetical protein
MTHITRDRGSLLHDDALDVVAMVVAQWMNVLIQDPNEALERHKRLAIDKEINRMLNRHKPSNNCFSSFKQIGSNNVFYKSNKRV